MGMVKNGCDQSGHGTLKLMELTNDHLFSSAVS